MLLAATLWGLTGTLFKRLGDWTDADAVDLAVIRAIGAGLMLGGWLLAKDRAAFRVPLTVLPRIAAFSLVTVTAFYLVLVWTFERTSVAVGTLLLYLAPAMVTLGAALLLGEPLTRRKVTALALTLVGCLLVVEAYRPAAVSGSAAGIGFGLLSAACYTTFSLGGKSLLANVRPPTLLFYSFAIGAGGLVAIKLLTAPDRWPPVGDVLLIVGTAALVTTLAPIVLFTVGLRQLPAGEASILASWEPVMAILVAAMVLGERPSMGQLAGAACVIAGVVVLATARRLGRARRASGAGLEVPRSVTEAG